MTAGVATPTSNELLVEFSILVMLTRLGCVGWAAVDQVCSAITGVAIFSSGRLRVCHLSVVWKAISNRRLTVFDRLDKSA